MANCLRIAIAAAALAMAFVLPLDGAAQELSISTAYEPVDAPLRIGPEPERVIASTDRGHTVIIPGGDVRGVILFLDGYRVTVPDGGPGPDTFEGVALANGLAILRITTGNPLDFYFEEATMRDVADRIDRALAEADLMDVPIFFAGLSLGGTRALKLAVYLRRHPDRHAVAPAAVAVVDAPLDMTRLWHAEQKAARDAFHPAAEDEGRWVSYLLETHLGGTPMEVPKAYEAYSPYSFGARQDGNAADLVGLPLRAYHEPDVDWWIEHRRKSYYQINSIDLAALVTDLKLMGHAEAELVTTHDRRTDLDESPHTWSLVDNAALVRWFIDHG